MKVSKQTLTKYSIAIAVCGSIAIAVLSALNFWDRTSQLMQLADLADAFTVAGLLPILIGALIWASTEGMFDGLGYAVGRIGAMFIPNFKSYRHLTYYDYKMERRGKRPHGYAFLFFVGLGYLSIGLIFLLLFKLKV